MATELLIVPLGDGNVPFLPIDAEADEALAYASGTKERDANRTFHQKGANAAIPEGYDSILKATELFDNADPPNSTGWKVEAIRTETVPRMYGGRALIAPARAGLPLALVRINSTQGMLDTINARLRGLAPTNFYGRVPLSVTRTERDAIADTHDTQAAMNTFDSKPDVRSSLQASASSTRQVEVANWQMEYQAILEELLQVPPGTIERTRVGEPLER